MMTRASTTSTPAVSRRPAPALRGRLRRLTRPGVVSVLSMMFLILFGSLAAAMAIMTRGNIITAATHQHVSRALGAAETGLGMARSRLTEAAARFVVAKGTVDTGFGQRLWSGSTSAGDGVVTVQAPTSYINNLTSPHGIGEALAQIHAQDQNTLVVNGINAPTICGAPSGTDASIYSLVYWVRTPAVALTPQTPNANPVGTAFQIDYAPLANGTDIRVIVTGYDFDYQSDKRDAQGHPVFITRRLMQDFSMVKRVNSAIVSPSKVMIGKNVLVEGDLGAAYTDVNQQNGDPIIMRSDFWGLAPGLDTKLTLLFDALRLYDIDKDNRLRLGHPIEGAHIPDFGGGYSGAAADVTGDGFVDEFDVFIQYYDTNHDGKVALSAALSAGTPNAGLSPEFVSGGQPVDDDLALLLDLANPDRNKNGVYSFTDSNSNGRYDPGEVLLDKEAVDPAQPVPPELQTYVVLQGGVSYVYRDQVLGFRDGVLDKRDNYAKVRGRVVVRVTDSTWAAAQGSYMDRVRGAVQAPTGQSPFQLGTPTSQLPDLDMNSFDTSETVLQIAANGDGLTFDQQVAANLGVSMAALAAWTPANNNASASAPHYFPLSPDANNDALPDNWQTAYFEKMPFASPNYYDFYYRPVYENMVFHNVQILEGNNGLFKNCTMVGVTFVRSRTGNTHPNWGIYGKMSLDPISGKPKPDPARTVYPGPNYPAMLAPTDRPVLMGSTPLDKADIPADQAPLTNGYNNLPDPLIMGGLRKIDTKAFSNNIRFHSCLFVGSIVAENPIYYTQTRNKLQFTGATKFCTVHPTEPDNPNLNPRPVDMPEIAKSSMMLPNYSVDIGNFNSPPTQDVRLKGAIVAGVMDVRGNADISGSLLLTFKPILGQAPLVDVMGVPAGNPAMFNSTIGYFGPSDGDDESLDPISLPVVNGVRIVGYDTNGDGIADVPPTGTPPNGAVAVPFWGYGRVTLRFDPGMHLPDGILLPIQIDSKRSTYRESAQ